MLVFQGFKRTFLLFPELTKISCSAIHLPLKIEKCIHQEQ